MRYGCRKLSHGGDAVGAPELNLHLSQSLFGVLPFGQIQYESDAFIVARFEGHSTDQYGHTGAVFPEILFLEWLQAAGLLQCWHNLLKTLVKPFGRRKLGPSQAAGSELFAAIPHHVQEGVIGFEDPPIEIPNENSDNIGVDQAPYFGFAFRQVAVQSGILQ